MSQPVENTTQDEQPQKRITNWHNGNVGRAAFIVGLLALEGHIPLDLRNRESLDEFGSSVRVVFEALEALESEDNFSAMPLMQKRESYKDWYASKTGK